MLLVEQNAKMALEIANRAYVLETGTIKMEGEATELANNIEVRKAYPVSYTHLDVYKRQGECFDGTAKRPPDGYYGQIGQRNPYL